MGILQEVELSIESSVIEEFEEAFDTESRVALVVPASMRRSPAAPGALQETSSVALALKKSQRTRQQPSIIRNCVDFE